MTTPSSSSPFAFEAINREPDAEDMKTLVDGMLSYHASKGHMRKTEYHSVLLRDAAKHLKGAIIVSFLWNGMHIDSLWIDESIRHQGWGSKLVKIAEEEALKRACTMAYTDTFTWQAPKFYEKQGYALYGTLNDFPKGNALFYYSKNLTG